MENNKKFAILTDTGSDVSLEMADEYGIYLIPLYIHYNDKSYKDRYDIDPKEVYRRIEEEIPRTSTPSIGEVVQMYEKIKADGYEELMVISISSSLSGTYNGFCLAAKEIDGINIEVIDSKNIAMGTGFLSLYASSLREKGMDFKQTVNKVKESLTMSKDFFTLETLKYLIEGGRIGRVAGTIGNLLHIKPIISCDENGVYYSVDKVRGRKKSINKISEIVKNNLEGVKDYYICLCNGGADEGDYRLLRDQVKDLLSDAKVAMEVDITSSLVVHTGPGLLGICIFKEEL